MTFSANEWHSGLFSNLISLLSVSAFLFLLLNRCEMDVMLYNFSPLTTQLSLRARVLVGWPRLDLSIVDLCERSSIALIVGRLNSLRSLSLLLFYSSPLSFVVTIVTFMAESIVSRAMLRCEEYVGVCPNHCFRARGCAAGKLDTQIQQGFWVTKVLDRLFL